MEYDCSDRLRRLSTRYYLLIYSTGLVAVSLFSSSLTRSRAPQNISDDRNDLCPKLTMAKNTGEGEAERKTVSSERILMDASHGYRSNSGLELPCVENYVSPLQASSVAASAACCNVIPSRSARQHPRPRRSRYRILLSVIVLMILSEQVCLAFQDPNRFARGRPCNKVLLSASENRSFLDDDSMDASRFQRLLRVSSAWRNGNMTSWDVVESVRALREGTKETTCPFVASFNATSALPPANPMDKMVGKVLGLVRKVVVLQCAITMLTSDRHALIDEVCFVWNSFFPQYQHLRLSLCRFVAHCHTVGHSIIK